MAKSINKYFKVLKFSNSIIMLFILLATVLKAKPLLAFDVNSVFSAKITPIVKPDHQPPTKYKIDMGPMWFYSKTAAPTSEKTLDTFNALVQFFRTKPIYSTIELTKFSNDFKAIMGFWHFSSNSFVGDDNLVVSREKDIKMSFKLEIVSCDDENFNLPDPQNLIKTITFVRKLQNSDYFRCEFRLANFIDGFNISMEYFERYHRNNLELSLLPSGHLLVNDRSAMGKGVVYRNNSDGGDLIKSDQARKITSRILIYFKEFADYLYAISNEPLNVKQNKIKVYVERRSAKIGKLLEELDKAMVQIPLDKKINIQLKLLMAMKQITAAERTTARSFNMDRIIHLFIK